MPRAVSAVFDEPNLIADAGLVPLIRLAERVGLPALVGDRLHMEGAGSGAGTFHARATTATLRDHLIHVPPASPARPGD
ncbi:hypothetical protein [Kitasatospora herbaricolor]|uniref:hypothetical protein n=1 Tax=Kitasatospora herbaricolor TaxID=68217 RepID=UPI0036DCC485